MVPPTPSAAYDPRASSPPPTYFDKFTPMTETASLATGAGASAGSNDRVMGIETATPSTGAGPSTSSDDGVMDNNNNNNNGD